jgi:hypothetical protein
LIVKPAVAQIKDFDAFMKIKGVKRQEGIDGINFYVGLY